MIQIVTNGLFFFVFGLTFHLLSVPYFRKRTSSKTGGGAGLFNQFILFKVSLSSLHSLYMLAVIHVQ